MSHYDEHYFSWQSRVGEFGGWANRPKFAPFISPQAEVLDFGCGGGYLLNGFTCAKKVGVEPNPTARLAANKFKIETFECAS